MKPDTEVLGRLVHLFVAALLYGSPSALAGQGTSSVTAPGVPITILWPDLTLAPYLAPRNDLAPPPDTTTSRRSPPNVFVTLAGASLGSFGGLLGGAYVGHALAYHGDGEYDGLVGVLVGGGFGAVLGSAVLGASMSGAPASEVFDDAFAGSFIGLMAGAAGAFAGGLTQQPVAALAGFFLGHGAATTLAVMNSDYFHRTNPD